MIKYRVSIGYRNFVFDNADEAMAFATMAKTHYDNKKDDDDLEVEIKIIIVNADDKDNKEE